MASFSRSSRTSSFGSAATRARRSTCAPPNWKNDTLIVVVVLLIGCAYELAGPSIFQLTLHQQLAGGLLSLGLTSAQPTFPS